MHWIVIAAGALGLFFGTANPLWHGPLLALLYPAALYQLSAGPEALRRGWLCGWLGSAAALYWIAVPVHDYGGMSWFLAVPCPLLLGAFVGLWGGLFCRAMAWVRQKEAGLGRTGWVRRCLMAGLLWYILEWARGWFLTGFPWLTLAAGQATWPLLIQSAALLGAYGLSGLLTFAACAAAEGMNGRRAPLAAAGLALLLPGLYGVLQLNTAEEGEPYKVVLVQGNIAQNLKWTEPLQRGSLEKYLNLSREALTRSGGADLVVWPETAMPFYYQRDHVYGERLRAFAQSEDTALIFGGPGVGLGTGESYNRAFLVNARGEDAGSYDKEHLVPFGEYVPPYLGGKIAEALILGYGGGFTPGAGGRSLPLERGEGGAGMLICYEGIFPELARERVASGATLLVNISNDAWYNYTSAAAQHLHLSLLRAVEQGRWLARATNTGISAFVDPRGRIHQPTALFTDTAIEGTVELLRGKTLFYWIQPWLPGFALAALALLIYPLAISPRKRNPYVASA